MKKSLARRLAAALGWILLTLAVLLGALWAILRIALAPQTGEWATEIGRGPFRVQASVPQLAWLGTTPWIGAALDGLRVPTRLGPVTLGWVPAGAEGPEPVLTLHCEPCTLPLPAALGQDRLTVPAVQIALSRDRVQHLRGTLWLAPTLPRSAWSAAPQGGARHLGAARRRLELGAVSPQGERAVVTAQWRAQRHGPGWDVTMQWPEAPARHWLALLAPDLPELRVAAIEGSVSATARVRLPAGRVELAPRVQGLAVSGLGTEAWAHVRSSCGPRRAIDPRGWLARAVLAAEDQRFHEHPGYDLEELLASLDANQQHQAIRRGGSTLTQQVAKLMVAGGERTLARKLRELLYAVEMEQTLGKARILQLYLNLAPWGRTAEGQLVCGADAAARHHFGVPARRLDARQAVTLAALLRNPGREAGADRLRWVAGQARGVPPGQRRALLRQWQPARPTVADADPVPGPQSLAMAGD
ncbi:MAG: biosynthetic peptidoglycan transglycosylase [Ottowia sp.]|uniref:biosynthetic peptidoglycan transglycosylase n=1 Tax=Ottowia sp. TaxID=1898956 RepID=UPI0039E5BA01